MIKPMPRDDSQLACTRCGRPVRVSAEQYEAFKRMHYVCFHYEFEHDPFDPDEECNAGGCPSSRIHPTIRCVRPVVMGTNALLCKENVACDSHHPSRQKGIRAMQASHAPAAVSASFDEPNLISCAGLEPVMALAEACGLAGRRRQAVCAVTERAGQGAGAGRRDGRRRGLASMTWTCCGTAACAGCSTRSGPRPRWARSCARSRVERKWSLLDTASLAAPARFGRTGLVCVCPCVMRQHAGVGGRGVVEGDAQAELDVPALDADVFEHETQQLLAAVEVEGVDAVQGALGEVGDAGAEAVVGGEFALELPLESWRLLQ